MLNPVAFKIFSHDIRWYGIMVATGVLAGYFLMQKNRKYADLSQEQVADICFFSMISGVLGARIFYVIEFFQYFQYKIVNGMQVKRQFGEMLLEMIRIDKGGIVFYGGFIGAVVTLFIYCRLKKLNFLRVFDMMAPSLALGHAFGRIGCLINGCCYGKIAHWGIHYPNLHIYGQCAGTTRIPVQLFESLINFLLAVILHFSLKKLKPGQVISLYCILYGTVRFLDEFLRGDNTRFFLGIFTPGQAVGLFVIPIGIAIFFYLAKRAKSAESELVEKGADNAEAGK